MNKLKQAVQETMDLQNISQSELSRRLGKSRNYLATILKAGCSTEKQEELIEQLHGVANGVVFLSDKEKIENCVKTAQIYSQRILEQDATIASLTHENECIRKAMTFYGVYAAVVSGLCILGWIL